MRHKFDIIHLTLQNICLVANKARFLYSAVFICSFAASAFVSEAVQCSKSFSDLTVTLSCLVIVKISFRVVLAA